MVQIRSLRNFFEMSSSSTRSRCKSSRNTSVSPHILTPFIESSIAAVAAIRRSIASSHRAWRCITRLVAPKEPKNDTVIRLSYSKCKKTMTTYLWLHQSVSHKLHPTRVEEDTLQEQSRGNWTITAQMVSSVLDDLALEKCSVARCMSTTSTLCRTLCNFLEKEPGVLITIRNSDLPRGPFPFQ
jgi:hypothetical protein